VIKELILRTFYIRSFDRTVNNKLVADIQGTQPTMSVLSDEERSDKNGTVDENARYKKRKIYINLVTCLLSGYEDDCLLGFY
jgi:hypothetical protein